MISLPRSLAWSWQQADNWPAPLRWVLLLLVATAVALLLGRCSLPGHRQALEQAQAQEARLRQDFRTQLIQVLQLDFLRQRRQQMAAALQEKMDGQGDGRLAKHAHMKDLEALLSRINRAGRRHDLRFELFRPGPFVTHPYYVEMPITLRASGRYQDIGAFAADLANHPRILVLDLLTLHPRSGAGGPADDRGNLLTLDAVVRAYRAPAPDDQPVQKRGAANGGRS